MTYCKYLIPGWKNHKTTHVIVYLESHLKLSFVSKPAITCSKLIIETLEQGTKYVQS